MANNKFWDALKTRINWGGRRTMWEMLAVTFLFPLAEAILVNLWTGAPKEQMYIPGMCLLVVALLHLLLGLLVVAGEKTAPEMALAEAVDVQNELDRVNAELNRRTESYRMVVSAVEASNLQTCVLDPWCKLVTFSEGLRPVIERLIQNINVTLGVSASQYTIEVYLKETAAIGPERSEPCTTHHGMDLAFFYSPQVECNATAALTNNSPAHLGLAKRVASEQHIEYDKPLFYANGQPKSEVYFRRFATIAFGWPCDDSSTIGVLVLTSMQNEPFAEDVLDTIRFMASIIANYTQSYSNCVAQQKYNKEQLAIEEEQPAEQEPCDEPTESENGQPKTSEQPMPTTAA